MIVLLWFAVGSSFVYFTKSALDYCKAHDYVAIAHAFFLCTVLGAGIFTLNGLSLPPKEGGAGEHYCVATSMFHQTVIGHGSSVSEAYSTVKKLCRTCNPVLCEDGFHD